LDEEGGMSAERKVESYGVYNQAQRMWFLFTPPELIGDALKEKIQALSIGAQLNGYKIENLEQLGEPVVLKYSFKGPECLIRAGNLRILPQLAEFDAYGAAKEERRFPIDFGILEAKEAAYDIEIPKNFSIKYLPQSILEDNKWFSFRVEYAFKDSIVNFRQSMQLKKTVVASADYEGFKNAVRMLAQRIKERIVLETLR